MTLEESIIEFYNNVKGDEWPSWPDLLATKPIPTEILQVIVASYQLPKEHNSRDRLEMLCELLELDQIPDAIADYSIPDPFVALYRSLQQDTWPAVEDFLTMAVKPYDVVEEIVAVCKQAPQYNYIVDRLKNESAAIVVDRARVKMHNYFFWSTVDFYKQQPEIFKLLNHTVPKEKYFDVLLGRRKYHRDLIYQQIDHEKNHVAYMSSDETVNLAACNHMNFVWPSEVLPNDVEITNTASIVKVNGIIVSLSQIIPVSIYNQTAYSLVSESQCENNFSFFTEKIIKPMLARRLFVVNSGRYYLKNLRSMGFKTFDGIIDESYDNEYRLHVRTDLLLEQVNYLYQCNQQQVYSQCQEILNHNFDLLMNTDWQKDMIQQISNDLVQFAHN